MSSCYEKAKGILIKHKKGLDLIAENLLEFETLTGDEIKDILNGKKMLERKMRRMRKQKNPLSIRVDLILKILIS